MSAPMVVAALLALAPVDGIVDGVEVSSGNRRFVARIAKVSGHEAIDDALARWQLSMHDLEGGGELWSMHYPHIQAPARYFVSDDGSTFVRMNEVFNDSRPVLRLDRYGERTVEIAGRNFAFERNDVIRSNTGASWMTEPGDSIEWGWVETEHGPALMLLLESQRGWTRDVDVSMGLVLPPFDLGEPVVFPGFPDGTAPSGELQVPYITHVSVPRVGLGALPLRIEVTGQHATPNWKFFAFAMSQEDENRFVLTPYSRPPPAGGLQAQVLDGFRVEAVVQGLDPGRYELAVQGAKTGATFHPIEVLPGRIQVRLRTTGGIAGINDVTEVFKPGIVRQHRSRAKNPASPRHLTPEEQGRLSGLMAELSDDQRSGTTTIGADLLEYRLGWWAGDRWREVHVDDGTARGPVKLMIEFLRRL